MAITWRAATWIDIEPSLSIQPRYRGDALVNTEAALDGWRHLLQHPFSAVTVLEANPPLAGHRLVGFGASVVVTPSFAAAELANPRPDINSRVIAGIHARQPVLASWLDVARANATAGIDIVALSGVWHHDILGSAGRQEAKILLASSFTERHAGYRIRRILCEAVDERTREFIEQSSVYQVAARFPETERVLYAMTSESANAVSGSLGNVLFAFREPLLRFRQSDQQLLRLALGGATDPELAKELGTTVAAIKARWRSTFARIAAAMPSLVCDMGSDGGRGPQKRNRVLAYVRSHPEELRPYMRRTKI